MRRCGEEGGGQRRRKGRRTDRRKRIIPGRRKAIPILGRFTCRSAASASTHCRPSPTLKARAFCRPLIPFLRRRRKRRVLHPSQSAHALHRVPGTPRVMAILSRSSSPPREPALPCSPECGECGYTCTSFWVIIHTDEFTLSHRRRWKFRGFLRQSRFVADAR